MLPSNRGLTAVLDIGSSKIVCVALDYDGAGTPRWAGLGVRPADGIKCGEVADPASAAAAISGAIVDAERSAGTRVQALVIGLAGGRLASVRATAAAALDPTVVRDEDARRLLRGAQAYTERDGRCRLHDTVIGFRLDGIAYDAPPIARFGRRLEADVVSVTADAMPVRRLVTVAETTGLPVVALIPLPMASALSVATAAEREHGVTVVDFGANLTSMITMRCGHISRVDTVALGGRQLTQDVATALQTPFASAERIKYECASVSLAHVGDADTSLYRVDSGSNASVRQTSDLSALSTAAMRGALHEIVGPRIDTVLRHVADHLDAVSFATAESGRVVLTGGGSQLDGLPAYAAQILGRPVRLGRPAAVAGLGAVGLPPFAAITGLVAMSGRPGFGNTVKPHRCVA